MVTFPIISCNYYHNSIGISYSKKYSIDFIPQISDSVRLSTKWNWVLESWTTCKVSPQHGNRNPDCHLKTKKTMDIKVRLGTSLIFSFFIFYRYLLRTNHLTIESGLWDYLLIRGLLCSRITLVTCCKVTKNN